jgi:hypothetical protein
MAEQPLATLLRILGQSHNQKEQGLATVPSKVQVNQIQRQDISQIETASYFVDLLFLVFNINKNQVSVSESLILSMNTVPVPLC